MPLVFKFYAVKIVHDCQLATCAIGSHSGHTSRGITLLLDVKVGDANVEDEYREVWVVNVEDLDRRSRQSA